MPQVWGEGKVQVYRRNNLGRMPLVQVIEITSFVTCSKNGCNVKISYDPAMDKIRPRYCVEHMNDAAFRSRICLPSKSLELYAPVVKTPIVRGSRQHLLICE